MQTKEASEYEKKQGEAHKIYSSARPFSVMGALLGLVGVALAAALIFRSPSLRMTQVALALLCAGFVLQAVAEVQKGRAFELISWQFATLSQSFDEVLVRARNLQEFIDAFPPEPGSVPRILGQAAARLGEAYEELATFYSHSFPNGEVVLSGDKDPSIRCEKLEELIQGQLEKAMWIRWEEINKVWGRAYRDFNRKNGLAKLQKYETKDSWQEYVGLPNPGYTFLPQGPIQEA